VPTHHEDHPLNLRVAVASLTALPILALASSAFADPAPAAAPAAAPEGRYPVAQAERPLTLPKMVLTANADLNIASYSSPGGLGGSSSFLNLGLGAAFGITDDLSVRAMVLPLQLTGPAGSGFHYGQYTGLAGIGSPGPSAGATYRFMKTDLLEVGGALDVGILSITGISGFMVTPGVPVRIHATKEIRIDTGAFIPILNESITVSGGAFGGSSSASTTVEGLNIPVSALYDINEPIHVGVATGFGIGSFKDVGNSTAVPLGIFAGYALQGSQGPMLDIDPYFMFPALLTPGNAAGSTSTNVWVLGVTATGYYYL